MDNYRRPMYNRYNRNMGSYQNPQCKCGTTPILDTRCDNHHDDHCEHHMDEHCEHHMDEHCEHHMDEHCEHHHEHCIDDMPLAMAYVPMQKWRNVMDGAAGLAAGTIFQELVLPFYGDKNNCGMRGDRS